MYMYAPIFMTWSPILSRFLALIQFQVHISQRFANNCNIQLRKAFKHRGFYIFKAFINIHTQYSQSNQRNIREGLNRKIALFRLLMTQAHQSGDRDSQTQFFHESWEINRSIYFPRAFQHFIPFLFHTIIHKRSNHSCIIT